MKNERIIKKGIFTFIVFVVCLVSLGALALNNTQKKVKADPISYYYSEIDDTHENYITITLYIFDAYTLVDNSAYIAVYGVSTINYYGALEWRDAQFLRYSAYDYMDYDAYIYNFQYTTYASNITP